MTTQATTTYDELCPGDDKPTAPTGCKAHRPWTPEPAATAAPTGRLTSSPDRNRNDPSPRLPIPIAAVPSGRTPAHRVLAATEPPIPLPALVRRDKEPVGVFLDEAKRELRQVIKRFSDLTVDAKPPITR
jgi:hypothetical protein